MMTDIRQCYGSEDEHGNPDCDGTDVREVSAVAPDGERFTTHWCAECRKVAQSDGYQIEWVK